jgi:hypothetical protein
VNIKSRIFIPLLAAFLVAVFSFEEFIYGRLPIGSTAYLIGKTSSELLLYIILSLVLAARMVDGQLLRYRPTLFDMSLALFLSVALLSTMYNEGRLVNGMINLRTMLRYSTVYYIVVLSGWVASEKQIEKLIKIIVMIALIQALLSVVQHFMGDKFITDYFGTFKIQGEIDSAQLQISGIGKKMGAAVGTFGKPAAMAFFMVLAATFAIALSLEVPGRIQLRWAVVYICIVIGILMSYKRGELLLALMAPMVVAWLLRHWKFIRLSLLAAPFALLLLVALIVADLQSSTGYVKEKEQLISPVQSFTQLFTSEYWNRTASASRGWMIGVVGKEVLSSFRLAGYGADEDNARAILASKGGAFGKLTEWHAFDDVYIIATLTYYGPLGVGILLFGFLDIFSAGKFALRYSSSKNRLTGVVICSSLLLMSLGSFLERILELRAFAFSFWVLAAIVVMNKRRLQSCRCIQGRLPLACTVEGRA